MSTDITRLSAAAQALVAVDTPADALKVMKMAEVARVYARQAELGTEAENAATAIRLKAEIRLAETVDEGQKRGEIARQGGDQSKVRDSDVAPATLKDIGVTKQRLSEARDMAAVMGPGQVDALLDEANAKGRTLSRSAVVKEVRQATGKKTDEFFERAERALLTDAERARMALDATLVDLVPIGQVIRQWRDYLTEQDRIRIENHIASLVDSIRQGTMEVLR